MSWNADMYDDMLRHQIGLRRLSTTHLREVLRLLDRSNRALTALLNDRLVDNMTTRRLQALLADARLARQATYQQLAGTLDGRLEKLVTAEQDMVKRIFERTISVQLDYATVSTARLAVIVKASTIQMGPGAAYTLDQWWGNLRAADLNRVTGAIQLGLAQEQAIPQIVRNVRSGFDIGRRQAEAVVRTAVNHVSNEARDEFFEQNSDIIAALRWTSTLDGRTSPVCRARDGAVTARIDDASVLLDPPEARPPAHPNCRSVMVPILNGEGIDKRMPDRPFVRDTRTRRMREKDFRAEARQGVGAARWREMTPAQRNALISANRRTWVSRNVGTVPGATTYDSWLRRQPAAFQNDVLGPGRAKLFRDGMKMNQFVDGQGKPLTLAQLQEA